MAIPDDLPHRWEAVIESAATLSACRNGDWRGYLAVIPLVTDPFWENMAYATMGGLQAILINRAVCADTVEGKFPPEPIGDPTRF